MESSTVIALEASNKLFVSKKPMPVDQLWFIAKNVDSEKSTMNNEILCYSHIYKEAKSLGCEYAEDVMTELNAMAAKTNVASCSLIKDRAS